MNNFFQKNTFIIDQKAWSIANSYKILDEDGQQIGSIQEDLPTSRLLLQFVISEKKLPFTMHLKDNENKIMASVEKKFSFMTATINIKDGEGAMIGVIKQKFTLLKPSYEIYDTNDKQIGTITGNIAGWEFEVKDCDKNVLAKISKSSISSLLKEMLTGADKYMISVSPQITDEKKRMIIIATSAIVDKIHNEDK